MTAGRPRKPVEELKLLGTYRKDRHAERDEIPKPGGEPIRPRGLGPSGRWMWDQVVKAFAGKNVLAEVDTAHLWAMCEMWELYRKVVVMAMKSPGDPRLKNIVIAYHAEFDRAAAKCGLSPTDRERLKMGKSEKPKGILKRDRGA